MDAVSSLEKDKRSLLLTLMVLVPFGIIMVYSSSYIYAKEIYGQSSYFAWKQIFYLLFSLALCAVVARTKIHFWLKYAHHINILVIFLILMTFIPGVSLKVKGANRWLNFGLMSLQPGEFLKYSIALSATKYFSDYSSLVSRDRIIFGLFLIFPSLLILLQPDYGTFAITFFVLMLACFLSDFPRKLFYMISTGGIILGLIMLVAQPYRIRRLMAFLDPWKNAKTSGFQVIQSYLAFANGSFWGSGLGNSNEKLFYLPEAHNDFIFSVVGEELGFVGVLFVVTLFAILIFKGFKIALAMKEKNSYILVTALIATIGLQAIINMGVVLGLLPTKGLNLPFISSGGSSLLANFFAIGMILANVRNQRIKESYSYISR